MVVLDSEELDPSSMLDLFYFTGLYTVSPKISTHSLNDNKCVIALETRLMVKCMSTNVQTDDHCFTKTTDNADQWIQQHYELLSLELQDTAFKFLLSGHQLFLVLRRKHYFFYIS